MGDGVSVDDEPTPLTYTPAATTSRLGTGMSNFKLFGTRNGGSGQSVNSRPPTPPSKDSNHLRSPAPSRFFLSSNKSSPSLAISSRSIAPDAASLSRQESIGYNEFGASSSISVSAMSLSSRDKHGGTAGSISGAGSLKGLKFLAKLGTLGKKWGRSGQLAATSSRQEVEVPESSNVPLSTEPPSTGDSSITLPFNFQHHVHVDDTFTGLPPSWASALAERGYSQEEILHLQALRARGRGIQPYEFVPASSDGIGNGIDPIIIPKPRKDSLASAPKLALNGVGPNRQPESPTSTSSRSMSISNSHSGGGLSVLSSGSRQIRMSLSQTHLPLPASSQTSIPPVPNSTSGRARTRLKPLRVINSSPPDSPTQQGMPEDQLSPPPAYKTAVGTGHHHPNGPWGGDSKQPSPIASGSNVNPSPIHLQIPNANSPLRTGDDDNDDDDIPPPTPAKDDVPLPLTNSPNPSQIDMPPQSSMSNRSPSPRGPVPTPISIPPLEENDNLKSIFSPDEDEPPQTLLESGSSSPVYTTPVALEDMTISRRSESNESAFVPHSPPPVRKPPPLPSEALQLQMEMRLRERQERQRERAGTASFIDAPIPAPQHIASGSESSAGSGSGSRMRAGSASSSAEAVPRTGIKRRPHPYSSSYESDILAEAIAAHALEDRVEEEQESEVEEDGVEDGDEVEEDATLEIDSAAKIAELPPRLSLFHNDGGGLSFDLSEGLGLDLSKFELVTAPESTSVPRKPYQQQPMWTSPKRPEGEKENFIPKHDRSKSKSRVKELGLGVVTSLPSTSVSAPPPRPIVKTEPPTASTANAGSEQLTNSNRVSTNGSVGTGTGVGDSSPLWHQLMRIVNPDSPQLITLPPTPNPPGGEMPLPPGSPPVAPLTPRSPKPPVIPNPPPSPFLDIKPNTGPPSSLPSPTPSIVRSPPPPPDPTSLGKSPQPLKSSPNVGLSPPSIPPTPRSTASSILSSAASSSPLPGTAALSPGFPSPGFPSSSLSVISSPGSASTSGSFTVPGHMSAKRLSALKTPPPFPPPNYPPPTPNDAKFNTSKDANPAQPSQPNGHPERRIPPVLHLPSVNVNGLPSIPDASPLDRTGGSIPRAPKSSAMTVASTSTDGEIDFESVRGARVVLAEFVDLKREGRASYIPPVPVPAPLASPVAASSSAGSQPSSGSLAQPSIPPSVRNSNSRYRSSGLQVPSPSVWPQSSAMSTNGHAQPSPVASRALVISPALPSSREQTPNDDYPASALELYSDSPIDPSNSENVFVAKNPYDEFEGVPLSLKPLTPYIRANVEPRSLFAGMYAIAEGQFGTVYAARYVYDAPPGAPEESSPMIAIKLVPVSLSPTSQQSDKIKLLQQELEIMSGVRHGNVLIMDDLYLDRAGSMLWIQMELMEVSLADILLSYDDLEGMLHERMVSRFARDALSGIAHLQLLGIAHRDVRSDNMLFNVEGVLKLADFANAIQVSPKRTLCQDIVGVPQWQAPEIRTGSYDPLQVDVWGVGATVWELIEGQPPFINIQNERLLPNRWDPLTKPELYSRSIHEFLRLCSEPASSRPRARDLLTSAFIKSACSHSDVVTLLARCREIEEERA